MNSGQKKKEPFLAPSHFKEKEGSLQKTQSLYKQLLAYIPSFLEDFPEPSKKEVSDNPFDREFKVFLDYSRNMYVIRFCKSTIIIPHFQKSLYSINSIYH